MAFGNGNKDVQFFDFQILHYSSIACDIHHYLSQVIHLFLPLLLKYWTNGKPISRSQLLKLGVITNLKSSVITLTHWLKHQRNLASQRHSPLKTSQKSILQGLQLHTFLGSHLSFHDSLRIRRHLLPPKMINLRMQQGLKLWYRVDQKPWNQCRSQWITLGCTDSLEHLTSWTKSWNEHKSCWA